MPGKHPNIVFFLADDLGWRDLACTGSDFYETPHLDRLRDRGMLFTQGYAACPVCSPTRASILTGKYPARVGITDYIDWKYDGPRDADGRRPGHARGRLLDAPYVDHMPENETTLAGALREEGYATWHVGKWHLGGPAAYPDRRGFDVNVGGYEAGAPFARGYFSPWDIPTLDDSAVPPGTYLDDHLGDEAVRLIDERDPTRPFFLNFAFYLVHTPIQAKPETIWKYEAKARQLGLDRKPTHVEGEVFPGEHKKHARVLRRIRQSHPTYAAMVEHMDDNVGKVLDALDRAGIAEDTIIVFTSDNGGLSTSEGSPTCNLPLAEGKGWRYEGGIREPLLVSYPPVVEPGTTSSTAVTSPDFYPTLLELAGLTLRPEQHVDGESFAPSLRGEARQRGPLFWHYPHYGNQGGTPGATIIDGRWKLLEHFETGRLELFDLEADEGEQHDRSADKPEKTRQLHGMLQSWQASIEAIMPVDNPDFRPWRSDHPELV